MNRFTKNRIEPRHCGEVSHVNPYERFKLDMEKRLPLRDAL